MIRWQRQSRNGSTTPLHHPSPVLIYSGAVGVWSDITPHNAKHGGSIGRAPHGQGISQHHRARQGGALPIHIGGGAPKHRSVSHGQLREGGIGVAGAPARDTVVCTYIHTHTHTGLSDRLAANLCRPSAAGEPCRCAAERAPPASQWEAVRTTAPTAPRREREWKVQHAEAHLR